MGIDIKAAERWTDNSRKLASDCKAWTIKRIRDLGRRQAELSAKIGADLEAGADIKRHPDMPEFVRLENDILALMKRIGC